MPAEVLAFIRSATGVAALAAPQLADADGVRAVEMMRVAQNARSAADLVALAASAPYGVPLRGASVLELGPGEGHGTVALLAHAPASVVAVEVSPLFRKMLRGGSEGGGPEGALAGALGSGLLTLLEDDAVEMPSVGSASVDYILSMNVVYFLRPLEAYLAEFLRVLKPGGWIIFGTKPAGAKYFPKELNVDNEAVRAAMAAAGFQDTAVAPIRLDMETPAAWEPVVGRKPEDASCAPGAAPKAGAAAAATAAMITPDTIAATAGGTAAATATTTATTTIHTTDAELLRQACHEYASLFACSDATTATPPLPPSASAPPSSAADGVAELCALADTHTQKIIELHGVLDGADNDLLVTRDVLLPQLLENTKSIQHMYTLIDELGHLVNGMEGSARATRDKAKAVQAAYKARNPQKMEKFLGSLNMFRSKKKTTVVGKPPMPRFVPEELPDIDAEFKRLRAQAWS
jgi:SAM-dependent methyltransferase